MKYSYGNKLVLNSKIAHDVHDWVNCIIPQWTGGIEGHNERVPTWHRQDGTKVMPCDSYEPTEDTDQAFQLLIDWDLLGSNIGYLMAAGIEVEDQYATKTDVHALSRIIICEAVLACSYDLQSRLSLKEEVDYAY